MSDPVRIVWTSRELSEKKLADLRAQIDRSLTDPDYSILTASVIEEEESIDE